MHGTFQRKMKKCSEQAGFFLGFVHRFLFFLRPQNVLLSSPFRLQKKGSFPSDANWTLGLLTRKWMAARSHWTSRFSVSGHIAGCRRFSWPWSKIIHLSIKWLAMRGISLHLSASKTIAKKSIWLLSRIDFLAKHLVRKGVKWQFLNRWFSKDISSSEIFLTGDKKMLANWGLTCLLFGISSPLVLELRTNLLVKGWIDFDFNFSYDSEKSLFHDKPRHRKMCIGYARHRGHGTKMLELDRNCWSRPSI